MAGHRAPANLTQPQEKPHITERFVLGTIFIIEEKLSTLIRHDHTMDHGLWTMDNEPWAKKIIKDFTMDYGPLTMD